MTLKIDGDWWKTLFDEVYLLTDARSVGDEELTRREVDLICRLIPVRPEDTLLDLCGGQGRHSLELCRRGFARCTVLDYSRTLLTVGTRNAAGENLDVAFVQGDARHLPHVTGGFDHVLVLGNSLGYAADGGSDRRILGEALRLLRPGGNLLVDVTNGRAVRDHFHPVAWHEIGADIVVCRRRELRGDVICAREMVLNKNSGLVRDRTYCMRLYGIDELAALVEEVGFGAIRRHADFSPSQGDGDVGFMNHRMVITARKR